MRVRSLALVVCGVLVAGLAFAPAATADDADCVGPLVAALSNPPLPPDPNELVIVNGLNVEVRTDLVAAYARTLSNHVIAAGTAFANCVAAEPARIAECVKGVVRMIVADIGPQSDDELYLRYVHLTRTGSVKVNGEYAVSDALAIAACV
ncbi:MAG: hypothetical protein M3271_01830 [Actinomycetota bacterium]|nr:hypothetical protein [Actinomycetota bacterium]